MTRRANKLRILPLIDVHRNVSARSTALELTPAIIATEHTLVVGAQTLHYKKITQSDVLHCGPRTERSSSLSDTRRAQSRWNVNPKTAKNSSRNLHNPRKILPRGTDPGKITIASNINNPVHRALVPSFAPMVPGRDQFPPRTTHPSI